MLQRLRLPSANRFNVGRASYLNCQILNVKTKMHPAANTCRVHVHVELALPLL